MVDTGPPPDNTPPDAPANLALLTASDSGVSGSDRITNVTNPVITGIAEADSTVTLVENGVSRGSGVADNNSAFSIQVNTPLADGVHQIQAKATDGEGNESGLSPSLLVTIDTSSPTVTIDQAGGQADPTNASPIDFTAAFNEDVVGFTAADISFSGTTTGTPIPLITGGPATYNVAVSGMVNDGIITVLFNPAAATDIAGNPNLAPGTTDNTVTYDTTPPQVTVPGAITTSATSLNGANVSFDVSASDAVGVVSGPTCSTASGTVVSGDLFALGSTTVTCTASDAAGNEGQGSFTVTVAELLGYWMGDDENADDSSVFGNHGKLQGGTSFAAGIVKNGSGGIGDAFLLDGWLTRVLADPSATLDTYNDHTYSFWIKWLSVPRANWQQILTKQIPDESVNPPGVSFNSPGVWNCPSVPGDSTVRGISWVLNPSGSGANCLGPGGAGTNFDLNQWYHIAGAKTGTSLTVYINGVGTSYSVDDPMSQGAGYFIIGNSGTFYSVNALIDDVRLYSYGLDATLVQAIYQADANLPPVVPALSDVSVQAVDSSGAPVSWALPNATDPEGESVNPVTCNPSSGSTFALGATEVSCTSAPDSVGNAGASRFTVVVEDTTPPDLTLPAPGPEEATGPDGATVTFTTPTATDLVAGTVPVSCDGASGSTYPLGTTPVTCSANDNLTSGLVSWWRGDGDASDAVDGNNGAPQNGADFASSEFGQAFSFDGDDDFVEVPDSANLSPHVGPDGQMTVEAWVKIPELPAGSRVVVAKGSPGTWEYALYITNTGAVGFIAYVPWGSPHTYTLSLPSKLTPNQWHHLVGTIKKGKFVRVYLDGVLEGESTAFYSDTADGASPLFIGKRGDGLELNGQVDEVRIYDRALSPGEVQAAFQTAGNLSNASFSVTVVDTIPPTDPTDVESTSHTLGTPSNDDTILMSWTPGTDTGGSGVDGYDTVFNNTSTPTCSRTKDLEEGATTTSSALADGTWYFHICTVDNAGNWTSTVMVGPFIIDTTDPVITKSVGAPKFVDTSTYVTSATLVTVSVSDNPGTGLASCSITVTGPDGSSNPSCAVGDNSFTLSSPDGPYPDGSYTISATATDNAGNTNNDPITVVLDNTPPTVTSSQDPVANLEGWNKTDVTVTFICDDGAGSGVDTCTDPELVITEGADQEAPGTGVDNLGNSDSIVHLLSIDRTAPTLSFLAASPAANAAGWNNGDVSIPFTTDDNLSGVSPTVAPSPLVLSAEGSAVTGDVDVTDVAGNLATFTSPSVNIDKTLPTDPSGVSSPSHIPGTPSNDNTINVTWTVATDPGGSGVDGYGYVFNQTAEDICLNAKLLDGSDTSVLSGELADGSWYFHICTVDKAGNWTATVTYDPLSAFIIDTTPPVVTPPGDISVDAEGPAGTPATNPDLAAFLSGATAFDAHDGEVEPVTNNAPATFAMGFTTVTFSATDAAGNTGAADASVRVITPRERIQAVIDLLELVPVESKRIGKAIRELNKSLEDKLWLNGFPDPKQGKKIFDRDRHAIKELMPLLRDKPKGRGRGKGKDGGSDADILAAAALEAIEALLGIDRTLAQAALDSANDATVVDPTRQDKVDKEIDKAQHELDKGDDELDKKKKPKFDKVIDRYRKAWKHAIHAVREAAKPPEDEEVEEDDKSDPLDLRLLTPGEAVDAMIAYIERESEDAPWDFGASLISDEDEVDLNDVKDALVGPEDPVALLKEFRKRVNEGKKDHLLSKEQAHVLRQSANVVIDIIEAG
jgi:hypothetical protein